MKQIKDNPVPLLDSTIQIVLNAALSELKKTENVKGSSEICEAIRSILQNGVETDKEQPKLPTKYYYENNANFVEITDGKIIKKYIKGGLGFALWAGYPSETQEYVFYNIKPDQIY